MTELDLSRLTDEERERIVSLRSALEGLSSPAHPLTADAHAIHLEDAEFWVHALIAARAENKRLLDGTKEVLADVEFSIKHSDDLGRKNTLSIVQEKLRALLQSEKGGE